mmetsp:Transcript_927/g.1420  ORF Transcript_927/g.1420 Transcript_927/m.1420 type:complete len:283 (-) Transcript_927:205-1053(-)
MLSFSKIFIVLSLPMLAFCFAPPPHSTRVAVATLPSLRMSTTTEEEVAVDVNPRKEGLALQLDDGTRKSHSIAQNSAFVKGFFKGLSNRDSYSKLLTSLYFVYVAMEEAFDATTEERVKQMDGNKELRRVDSARKDMEYFYGEGWEEKIKPSGATQRYVARIQEVARDNPKLLIGHQYTRYLGDLFGGQMMGGMATKSLGLSDGKGIDFYKFNDIDDSTDFITKWYTKLNALDLTDEEKAAIVDEANLIFALNIEILEELEGSAFKAVLKFVFKSFKEKVGL